MGNSRKYQIEEYIEKRVLTFFAHHMDHNITTTIEEREEIAPYLQMYQAIKMGELAENVNSIWRILVDGDVSVSVNGRITADVREQANKGGK